MRGICGSGAAPSRIALSTPTKRRPTTPPGSSCAMCSQIGDTEHFDGLDLRVNTSLARDLVEYKRELNKATSFVDQRMSNFVCAELERVVTDDGRYHDYLSPERQGEAVARRRARQRNARPGFRHDAISGSRRAKCQRLEVLSRSLARAGEGAERTSQQDQAERGISARTGDSVAAPGYPPVPRDVRFDRFRARLARIETRSATSLEAILASGWDAPAALIAAFVAALPNSNFICRSNAFLEANTMLSLSS